MAVTTPPAMELLDERERRSGSSSIWRDTLGQPGAPAERHRRWRGPALLHLHGGLRGCDRHAPAEPGPHRGRRRQEARASVYPRVRLPRDPAGALLRYRWQRPGRVQPGRARHAHLAPDRLRDGRVRHPHRRLHRRAGGVRRRQGRQLPDADHGRAARLSVPAPRDRHRDRARQRARQRPAGDRRRRDPDLRADHAWHGDLDPRA